MIVIWIHLCIMLGVKVDVQVYTIYVTGMEKELGKR